MGKQVRFYMLPEDERGFLDFVCQDSDVIVIAPSSSAPKPRIMKDPIISLVQNPELRHVLFWNTAYSIDKSHIRQLAMQEYSVTQAAFVDTGAVQYFIETSDAPVIEFARSFIRKDGRLVKGRIWAEMYKLGESKLAYKGKGFEAWYDKIALWLRRNFKRINGVDGYIGHKALIWHQEGGQLSKD